jgi:hypothetical protein
MKVEIMHSFHNPCFPINTQAVKLSIGSWPSEFKTSTDSWVGVFTKGKCDGLIVFELR